MKKIRNRLSGLLIIMVFLMPVMGFSGSVPDTGQTKCYDDTGEIPCPNPGEDFYGQAGNYTINPMSYSKLGVSGNALEDNATSWAMVRDNVTGLIWEIKQDQDRTPNYANPHDADNVYTWYDPNDQYPGTPGTGTDTNDFINALNNSNFGGYSDWRIPSIKELAYIIQSPDINTNYFQNTQSDFSIYWSSSTLSFDAAGAWGLYFPKGNDHTWGGGWKDMKKFLSNYVHAVRGRQAMSSDNMVINGDGTVTDKDTGLMWQQITAPDKYSWQQALAYAENLDLAGHEDWRLPTIKELRSLVDFNHYSPAINTTFFPEAVSSDYWSSNTNTGNCAWYVGFYYGAADTYSDFSENGNKGRSLDVRSLRGGQSGATSVDDDGDGYTTDQGDCNDKNKSIHPGATDICNDGIDQNCDGVDLSCTNSPSAPTGVAASDGTLSGKVQVSWTPATGTTSYDVYRAAMPAWTGTAPKRIASSVSGTSYDDTSAVSGSRYYYWVKSRNSGGVSKYSNFDAGYWGSMGSIPAVPTNVSATDGSVSGKVNITWDATANTLIYEIWRADIPAFLGGKMKKVGTSATTSYNDATVVNGNRYYYWIKARNSWGVSRYSKFNTGYIGTSSSPLPAPTGVSATDGTVSGKVTITWNTVTGSMVYEVWRATDLVSAGGKPVRVGFLSGISFNDTSGAVGTTYYYWVKARDSWGSSKYSVPDTGYRNSLENLDEDNDGDGFTEDEGDCDDSNININPGEIEICGDSIDQDCNDEDLECDPDSDDIDNDGDGYAENDGDCNDDDDTINPGVDEVCYDFIDNDCDGDIDCEDDDCFGSFSCLCIDADSDGYYSESGCGTSVDCNDADSSINLGADEICNDTIDNDCDGRVDCDDNDCSGDPSCYQCTDADSDGYYAESGCSTLIDCNDDNAGIHPGANDVCGDGIDQDCDGTDPACGSNGPWVGNWILINFLGDDEDGWDEDDYSGIGYVATITEGEWIETADVLETGESCIITYSYIVDDNYRYSKEATSVSDTCPWPVGSFLNGTGTLEFSNGNNIMIEYFDVMPGDTLIAYKWMRQ